VPRPGRRECRYSHNVETSAPDWMSVWLHSPAALPGGRPHSVNLAGTWMGPRARFDILEIRKICYFCWKSNHESSNVQPVASSLYRLSRSHYRCKPKMNLTMRSICHDTPNCSLYPRNVFNIRKLCTCLYFHQMDGEASW